ncbi:hypothetical protein SELMODRAFT_112786 [Selaginella moellendorffii]|uniref:Uncharacterized protein GA20oxL1-2 n=2 Tax=Selaginella moellendorffii TaxID=88036 RepID=D8SB40_SELML|nr:hypothetical protein SELMODRAFT_112786 [Selaginella moellendorffii]
MAVQSRPAGFPSFASPPKRDRHTKERIPRSLLQLQSSTATTSESAAALERQNICKLSALLKDTNLLPERYVIPESHRARLSHDAFLPEVELPMIDFETLKSGAGTEILAREVGNACRDWGFFQIVNHGVPGDLIQEMLLHADQFFHLPYRQKEKAAIFPRPLGYNGRYTDLSSSAPWVEAMAMQQTPYSTVDKTVDRVWPGEGNPRLRRALRRYHAEMEKLGQSVVQLIALSLGLERRTFSRHFEESSSTFRWNHYPPCPLPSKALGLLAHSDPSAITILHQDSVGGLQIRKDGRWIAVKPRPDTFVINLGDVFQAWTNGRYKSVEHRAVVNQKQGRLSMVFFYGPQEDYVITPPDELIDEDHPLRYRPFTWGDYSAARLSIPAHGKRHLDVFAGAL